MTIGERLKAYRLANERTVTYMARKIGVSPQMWHNWEAGRYRPEIRNAKRISDFTGIPLETFAE